MIDVTSDPQCPLGFLTDWDLSKHESELKTGATQNNRSVSSSCRFEDII